MKKDPFKEGWSQAAWKSLAVKSNRMGWPAGLAKAASVLGRSEIRVVLLCNLFEDVFPSRAELPAVLEEIRTHDYAALCARATHHSRAGLTEAFAALKEPACAAAKDREAQRALWAAGKELKVWLPLRSLNCFWTWQRLAPDLPASSGIRDLDPAPYLGMPAAMIDGHTFEGKRRAIAGTVLSGSYSQHVEIARRVAKAGWKPIRAEVHAELTAPRPRAGQMELSV